MAVKNVCKYRQFFFFFFYFFKNTCPILANHFQKHWNQTSLSFSCTWYISYNLPRWLKIKSEKDTNRMFSRSRKIWNLYECGRMRQLRSYVKKNTGEVDWCGCRRLLEGFDKSFLWVTKHFYDGQNTQLHNEKQLLNDYIKLLIILILY